eukprot:ANDGO_02729.mRNA.1 hypothetical protein
MGVVKRTLNGVGVLLISLSLAALLVGYLYPYWLQWDDPSQAVPGFVSSDSIRWGIFKRELKYKINDDTYVVHTDIGDVPSAQQPEISDYETTADITVILGIVALALTGIAWLQSIALLAIGTKFLAFFTTLTTILAFIMTIVTWAYFQGSRPKGANGDWDEYRVYASFGLWVASSAGLGISAALFTLGGSGGSLRGSKSSRNFA